jgi:hypothetical protein
MMMKRMVLGGLITLLLGTAALVPQAEARCWWNGFAWHCAYPHWWGPHAYWWHPWHHRYVHHYAYYHHPYPYVVR